MVSMPLRRIDRTNPIIPTASFAIAAAVIFIASAIAPAAATEIAEIRARLRPCQDKDRAACTQLMSIGTKPVGASGNSMDLDAFWRIVEDARSGASDDEDFLRRIGSRLHMLKPEELLEFESRRSKLDADSYSWRLWGAAYLMNGGCSDDCFDYFRAWLISQGRRTFEKALKDPDTLADVGGPTSRARELEEFMSLAQEAYEKKTGREMPDTVFQRADRLEPSERWNFDDVTEMKKRYPKLFAKYR